MLCDSIPQHEAVGQVVDVLTGAGKVGELQDLRKGAGLILKLPFTHKATGQRAPSTGILSIRLPCLPLWHGQEEPDKGRGLCAA